MIIESDQRAGLRVRASTRSRLLVAVCGILGPVILVASFVINPAPPVAYSVAQLRNFALQHHDGIVLGGWLQGMGSLLIVLFSLGLVHLANATQRLAGWVTLLAGAVILVVSLLEVTFYLAAVQATEAGDTVGGLTANNLIKAVQHVFLIAPAVLLPLGVVLRSSRILPRGFAETALSIGAALQLLGLVGLLLPLQSVIDVILIAQSLWFVAAAVAIVGFSARPDNVGDAAA
jgi:hypothetical protein